METNQKEGLKLEERLCLWQDRRPEQGVEGCYEDPGCQASSTLWFHHPQYVTFYSWSNIAPWTPALTASFQSAGKEERKAHPYPLKKGKRVYWSKTLLFTFYGAQLHPTATHRFKGIQERQFYRMEMDSFLGTPWEFLSLSYLSASLCVPDWAFSLQMTSSRRQGGGNSLLQLFTYTVWVPLWCLLIKFQGRADKPEFYQMSVLGTISMFEKGAQASFPTEDGIFCFKRWIKFWENSRLGGGIQKTKKVIID